MWLNYNRLLSGSLPFLPPPPPFKSLIFSTPHVATFSTTTIDGCRTTHPPTVTYPSTLHSVISRAAMPHYRSSVELTVQSCSTDDTIMPPRLCYWPHYHHCRSSDASMLLLLCLEYN